MALTCSRRASTLSAIVFQDFLNMAGRLSRYKWNLTLQEGILIFITMIWGGTFMVVHHAMTMSGPFFFVGVRFATAALLLMLFSWRSLRGFTRQELLAGLWIGIAIGCGYGLQTWGMQTISGSQSAFITALYVPLVPLLQWAFLGKMPGLMSWCGVVLAFGGLLLVAGPKSGGLAFNQGEIATLLSTLAIAAEIILISASAGKVDIRRVTIMQLAIASLFSFLLMQPNGESVPTMSPYLWCSALGLGLASALIQVTMNWAQRSVSPTRATVIYAGEPVWAGVVGRIAGERLPGAAMLGGGLIVLGVLVSELKLKRRTADRPAVSEE
jgi:drug/metabolite transporter (DMT)-like permease